ncbi:PspC domain-containing protein [Micromonospora sp. NBC_01655]|uniref:PspC domain-containing protein n=1 Tax=Micromonospora sp. NBC_01655 TaxID=2975983 RepID=UPI00225A2C22|nr:PspC domain-containing protein [Micromonospora sp. NBC_01655]MCX4470054.1 PspC domain-containing protein [Micromonospora sp. NBC_01655]
MTEEAAPSPRPGAARPDGPPPADPAPTTPASWTAPTAFGPATPGATGSPATPAAAASGAPAGPGTASAAGPEASAPGGWPPPTAGPDPAWSPPPGAAGPPPAGGTPGSDGPSAPPPPPPGGYAAPPPPPPEGAGFTSRYGLVRPREGRYLAGVCAAIGRATNTDPVLWRVLLAVLGFFGGIGILVYVTAWLIIPGEGDTASPVESMLGRGRSSMSPVTVIVLSILVAVSFGYIVTDAFRAVLLGAAILVGGALLLNRERGTFGRGAPADRGPVPGVPNPTPPGPVPPVAWPAPGLFTPPAGPGRPPVGPPVPGQPSGAPFAGQWSGAPAPGQPAAAWATAPAGPATGLPAWPPAGTPTGSLPPVGVPTTGYPPVAAPRPPAGYRPPFAPHGPYARGPYAGGPQPAPPPPRPVKPPKPPRERSPLGAVTFSLVFLALGVVAVLDLLDVIHVGAAAYFAAALATVGLGLLVGAWFGRARWLIALGLVTVAALGIATVTESYDRIRGVDGDVTWAPTDRRDLADRYENNFGDAVLDLRGIDFDKHDTQVTVAVNFGQATVVVPPNVDVTTIADVNAGDATIFGNRSGGLDGRLRESTDLGADGPGGGRLRLYVHVNAGNLEVTR